MGGPGRPSLSIYPAHLILASLPHPRYNGLVFERLRVGRFARIRATIQRGMAMKSAARLALILACMGIGLNFIQYLVRFLPVVGMGGSQSMMLVYNITSPLSILLHSLPIIVLSIAIMKSSED